MTPPAGAPSGTPETLALLQRSRRDKWDWDYSDLWKHAERLEQQRDRAVGLLREAVGNVKAWHNMGVEDGSPADVWQIYYDNAPEMKAIRAFIREIEGK